MMNTECKNLVQILNYFAKNFGGKIEYKKAVSLLYLVDRYHLRMIGSYVTKGIWYANRDEIINSILRDLLKGTNTCQQMITYANAYLELNAQTVTSLQPIDSIELSYFDIMVLGQIIKFFGEWDSTTLTEFIFELPEIIDACKVAARTKYPMRIHTSETLRYSDLDYILLKKYGLQVDPFYLSEDMLSYVRAHIRV